MVRIFEEAGARRGGRPLVDAVECNKCQSAVKSAPRGAFARRERRKLRERKRRAESRGGAVRFVVKGRKRKREVSAGGAADGDAGQLNLT